MQPSQPPTWGSEPLGARQATRDHLLGLCPLMFWVTPSGIPFALLCRYSGCGVAPAPGEGVFSCWNLLIVPSPVIRRRQAPVGRGCGYFIGLYFTCGLQGPGGDFGVGETTPISKLTAAERAGDMGGGERRDPCRVTRARLPFD